MERKTGIVVAACALAGMAVAFWVVGGFALAAEAVYPVEKSASWFSRNVTCRVRTLWRRQNYGAENARLRRENDILRMALQEAENSEPETPNSKLQTPIPNPQSIFNIKLNINLNNYKNNKVILNIKYNL